MPYLVYILHSNSFNKFYIGSTGDDISERLRRHNSNHKGFTGKANDWIIVYTETCIDKTNALKREREIKGWKSSIRIRQLIAENDGASRT